MPINDTIKMVTSVTKHRYFTIFFDTLQSWYVTVGLLPRIPHKRTIFKTTSYKRIRNLDASGKRQQCIFRTINCDLRCKIQNIQATSLEQLKKIEKRDFLNRKIATSEEYCQIRLTGISSENIILLSKSKFGNTLFKFRPKIIPQFD